mmetsp:Transcript_54624/g.162350  ORF Transcript_54624/g.162350 Transcript_54624/m.162350 type:complete len:80 (+) Transcript_54624:2088-2327(+)
MSTSHLTMHQLAEDNGPAPTCSSDLRPNREQVQALTILPSSLPSSPALNQPSTQYRTTIHIPVDHENETILSYRISEAC